MSIRLKGFDRDRLLLRIVLPALVFFLVVSFSIAAVKGQGDVSEEAIRGSTTIKEIEKDYQVPPTFLIERLNMPKETSLHAPLKDLKERHGFEIEAVRVLVKEYRSGKAMAKIGATVATGSAASEKKKKHEDHKQTLPISLILGLYFLFCIVMQIGRAHV